MKILLTGHRGFIGSNMLLELQKHHSVTTFEWGEPPVDVRGHDWVIHLGAISSTAERNVEKILAQNLDYSCWLLQQCIHHGVNFQYASSASVYGSHSGINEPFSESDPVDPRSPYAWSKYLFERHANCFSNANILIQGFRYFNVWGPGEDHKGDQASPQHKFRKQFNELGYVTLFDDSDKFCRDFIHVSSVIDYHIKFLNVPESGIWNIGTGKTKSFFEIANEITTIHRYIPMPALLVPSYQSYTCANISKLKNTLRKYEKSINSNS